MLGWKEEYEQIEDLGRNAFSSYLSFGEWIFFAFSMEPNSELGKSLGKLIPATSTHKALPWCKGANENETLRKFATELLESGETIFMMSEKFRSNGGMGHT